MSDEKGFRFAAIKKSDLYLVSPAPPPDKPPLQIGDWCTLNSGSPPLLVVDADEEAVTVSLPTGKEQHFQRACVRRCQGEQ